MKGLGEKNKQKIEKEQTAKIVLKDIKQQGCAAKLEEVERNRYKA